MKIVSSFCLLFCVIELISISGCSKEKATEVCTLAVTPIVINFNVVDKATNKDLYFSSSPTIQIKDLYFFKKKDVARKDTIRPTITGAGTSRSFKFVSDYTSFQDTLILKTGNLSDNTLIYTIKKTDGECVNYQLGTLSFNGSVITPSSDKYIFVK